MIRGSSKLIFTKLWTKLRSFKMKNKLSSALILLGASLFGLVVAASPSSAATREALIKLSNKSEFVFSGVFVGVKPAAFGVVDVGTGTVPTIQVPRNLVAQARTFTYTGPQTAFATRTETLRNDAATLGPNNPLATGTAQRIGKFSTNFTTSICFNPNVVFDFTNRPSFEPLAPAYTQWPAQPGDCNPKPGEIRQTPGDKKYGGTLRIFGKSRNAGKANLGAGGTSEYFALNQQRPTFATGPSEFALNVQFATGVRTGTAPSATARQNQVWGIDGFFSTGAATVSNPGAPYSTYIPRAGSFGLVRQASTSANTANLSLAGDAMTGSISVVRPGVSGTFNRVDGVFTSQGGNYGELKTVELSFLPEPTLAGLLGMGLIGLVSLRKLRQA